MVQKTQRQKVGGVAIKAFQDPEQASSLLVQLEQEIMIALLGSYPMTIRKLRQRVIEQRLSVTLDSEEELQALVRESKEAKSGYVVEKIRKQLENKDLKFPGYSTIEKHLKLLEQMGLVQRRVDTRKSGNYLWFTNPGFESKWKNIRLKKAKHVNVLTLKERLWYKLTDQGKDEI